jgi:hypothetical protein
MRRITAMLGLLLCVCGVAAAQGKGAVGILAGGYWLTRGETKDLFGDVWPDLDLELRWAERAGHGGLTVDLSYRHGHDDGTATLIPLTFGWWENLDDWSDEPRRSWRSYAAVRVGPYYGTVSRIGGGETTVGLNAHLMIGSIFGRRFLAEIRYDWYTTIADTNFEGFTFQIGYLLNP